MEPAPDRTPPLESHNKDKDQDPPTIGRPGPLDPPFCSLDRNLPLPPGAPGPDGLPAPAYYLHYLAGTQGQGQGRPQRRMVGDATPGILPVHPTPGTTPVHGSPQVSGRTDPPDQVRQKLPSGPQTILVQGPRSPHIPEVLF